MSTAEIIVTVGGVAAIVWVNWYFFLAGKAPTPKGPPGRGKPAQPLVQLGGPRSGGHH